jgi:hypothetical protein
MSDTLSGEQMQAKITAARREAEGLKDKIKRKKDELADTSRMITLILASSMLLTQKWKILRIIFYAAQLFLTRASTDIV